MKYGRGIVASAIIILLFLNFCSVLLLQISVVAQSVPEKTLVYEDSFENGISNWWDLTVDTPTTTNEIAHSGNYSYVTDEDNDVLYHSLNYSDQIANWEIEIWFYDSMSGSPAYTSVAADWAPGQVLGVLIWSGGEYDNFYGYRYGSLSSINPTTYNRSVGWHKVNIVHDQNLSYILLDDGMVYQANQSIQFNYFGIGDNWRDGIISRTYYDDLKFWEYYTPVQNSSLTIDAGIGGTTDPVPGSYNYANGSSAQVNATANTDYCFDHWELDGVSAGNSNSVSVVMDTNHTLKAVFRRVQTYALTITMSDGGRTTPSTGTYNYAENSTVAVTALANENYTFYHWELDAVNFGDANPCTVLMDSNHTLEAFFERLPVYSLTIIAAPGGITTPVAGVHAYSANSTIQINATADNNYYFDHWELDGSNITGLESVLMNENHTLKAFFVYTPPFFVYINPINATVGSGCSVNFVSETSEAVFPCQYKWCLNGSEVDGANSSNWVFVPQETGTYDVTVRVEDSEGNSSQSETSWVRVESGLSRAIIDVNCVDNLSLGNYGLHNREELIVEYTSTGMVTLIFLTYLKFDLSMIPQWATVDSVSLQLKVKGVGLPLSTIVSLYNTTAQECNFNTLNWNNKPLLDSALATAEIDLGHKGEWFSWETETLRENAERATISQRNLTLVIVCSSFLSYVEGQVIFYSMESGFSPKLEITYGQDTISPPIYEYGTSAFALVFINLIVTIIGCVLYMQHKRSKFRDYNHKTSQIALLHPKIAQLTHVLFSLEIRILENSGWRSNSLQTMIRQYSSMTDHRPITDSANTQSTDNKTPNTKLQ